MKLFKEAITRLARCRMALHLAHARFVYSEWLRRENRRTEARCELRAAHHSLRRSGAEAFADRSRRELLAAGGVARGCTGDVGDLLTPQEIQIARLAGDGRTNPEIGAQLYISPRTVEYHLSKVFPKLNLTSGREVGFRPRTPTGHDA